MEKCEGTGKIAVSRAPLSNGCPDCCFFWESEDHIEPPEAITPEHAPEFDDATPDLRRSLRPSRYPRYRWEWSFDGDLCTLWRDRRDRVEKLGWFELTDPNTEAWTVYMGDVMPIRSRATPGQSLASVPHELLWAHGAPDVPLPPRPDR